MMGKEAFRLSQVGDIGGVLFETLIPLPKRDRLRHNACSDCLTIRR